MGPTQSAVAWGCAEDKRDYQEGLATRQRELKQAMTAHQHLQLPDDPLASQSPYPDTQDESHHVTVNPVYEFALCRKIKETFRKGDTSEQHSQIEMEQISPSLTETDTCASSIVSVQPQSFASDAEPDTHPVSHPSDTASQLCQTPPESCYKSQTGDQLNQQQFAQNEAETEKPSHESDYSTVITKYADLYSESCEENLSLNQPKTNEANVFLNQAEIPKINQAQDAESAPNQQQTSVQTDHGIHTETKATQTTQTHPGDISLSPPPPRPLMISVSTPPDETSPMFYKLSQVGSYLTDDIPSSPDVESDASDAGYVHLRSRFGSSASQDGGAGAASAAAGASETTAEGGRRKRSKKKEEKSIEYVLRALNNLGTPQEKLTVLCKKYTDLHEEQKGLHVLLKQHQRKINVIQREKDQLQTEHNKVVMTKCKLESLCRELQKQNKVVKDESLLRLKEEEDKRKKMSAKFQSSITEIQAQVNENHEQNLQLREENKDLSARLRTFLEQHQLREEHLDKLSHHRDLELQLAEARLEQASVILRDEQEQHLKEKERILLQANEGEKKNAVLEAELTKYKHRYEEFQVTISKSSQMFQKLKSDMDRMGNRIKKLEKEGEQWKAKWETSSKALQEVTQEKAKSDKENQTLQTKVTKLESLCRALQAQHRETSKTTNTLQPSDGPCIAPASPVSTDNVSSSIAGTTTVTARTHPEGASSAELSPDAP